MKLTVLGGGGFRVPLIYRALAAAGTTPGIEELCLYDVSEQRQAAIGAVLDQMAASAPSTMARLRATTSLDDALEGARFVFSAIRIGGLAGRVADERVALDLGVLGQETTGPGGIAFGLRTVPVCVAIARRVAVRCPDAWFINFTNPAGMITEAMQSVLGSRVIGICDSPMGLARRAKRALDLPPAGGAPIVVDYAGLNHLGWLQRLVVDGHDRLPELLADDRRLAATEEGQLFGGEWLRTIGAIPNEYVYYYDFTRDAMAAIGAGEATRGEYLLTQQADFYERVAACPSDSLRLWDEVRLARNATYMQESRDEARDPEDVESGGYEGVAVALMRALAGGEPAELILNVRNDDGAGPALPGLPADAVIEVPCRVDASGARPQPVSPLRGSMLGLVQQVKAVEQLTIEAALARSARQAIRAFAAHPLVDSVNVARRLFEGYCARIPDLATVFSGSAG